MLFSSLTTPSSRIRILIMILTVGIVLGIYRMAQTNIPTDSAAKIEEDVRKTTEAVGKLMLLPAEKPVVATVKDATKLDNQAFFRPAVNGDKVLFYNEAKKAILYRPSTNKIITTAPITFALPSQ